MYMRPSLPKFHIFFLLFYIPTFLSLWTIFIVISSHSNSNATNVEYTLKIYFWSIIINSSSYVLRLFFFLALIQISSVIPGSLLLPAYFYNIVLYLIKLFPYSCFYSVAANSDICGLEGCCLLLPLSLLVFTSSYVWGLFFWAWVEENSAGTNGACFLQMPLASVSAENWGYRSFLENLG